MEARLKTKALSSTVRSQEINSKIGASQEMLVCKHIWGGKMQKKRVKGDSGSSGELDSREKRNREWLNNFFFQF